MLAIPDLLPWGLMYTSLPSRKSADWLSTFQVRHSIGFVDPIFHAATLVDPGHVLLGNQAPEPGQAGRESKVLGRRCKLLCRQKVGTGIDQGPLRIWYSSLAAQARPLCPRLKRADLGGKGPWHWIHGGTDSGTMAGPA